MATLCGSLGVAASCIGMVTDVDTQKKIVAELFNWYKGFNFPEYQPENLGLEVMKSTMWNEYNERCITCGRCNFVCPTCTCFTMQDIFYKENENVGERRRVWASCHVDGYTDMAGGHSFRKLRGDRMRFKTLHKIYDFNKRFGYQMCVGCGRCDDACPQYISLSECIDNISDTILAKEGAK